MKEEQKQRKTLFEKLNDEYSRQNYWGGISLDDLIRWQKIYGKLNNSDLGFNPNTEKKV